LSLLLGVVLALAGLVLFASEAVQPRLGRLGGCGERL